MLTRSVFPDPLLGCLHCCCSVKEGVGVIRWEGGVGPRRPLSRAARRGAPPPPRMPCAFGGELFCSRLIVGACVCV